VKKNEKHANATRTMATPKKGQRGKHAGLTRVRYISTKCKTVGMEITTNDVKIQSNMLEGKICK
jgi:hypothetical protein